MLDRQRRKIGKPFVVDGKEILYPGYPLAVGELIYNCCCTITAAPEGVDMFNAMRRARDPVTGRNVLVKDMSYKEWEAAKRGLQQNSTSSIVKKKIETGEYSTKISVQKQYRHIQGTKQFEEYARSRKEKGKTPQSILTVDTQTAQKLVDRYCGAGVVAVTKEGKSKDNEFVTADIVIGKQYTNNEYHDTHRMSIHYSKKGAHIVPVSEK